MSADAETVETTSTRPPVLWAWLTALSPLGFALGFAVVDWFGLGEGGTAAASLLLVGAMWTVIAIDAERLYSANRRVSAWWGILFPPLYLFLRARKLSRGYHLPVIWLVLFLAHIALILLSGAGEQSIAGSYRITGQLTSCGATMKQCPRNKDTYNTQWTITNCHGDTCTIYAPSWSGPTTLTRENDRWVAVGTRATRFSDRCRGLPLVTSERLELTAQTSNGVPALSGTAQTTVPPTTCTALTQSWNVTGIAAAR